jgi:hypothetical protein
MALSGYTVPIQSACGVLHISRGQEERTLREKEKMELYVSWWTTHGGNVQEVLFVLRNWNTSPSNGDLITSQDHVPSVIFMAVYVPLPPKPTLLWLSKNYTERWKPHILKPHWLYVGTLIKEIGEKKQPKFDQLISCAISSSGEATRPSPALPSGNQITPPFCSPPPIVRNLNRKGPIVRTV